MMVSTETGVFGLKPADSTRGPPSPEGDVVLGAAADQRVEAAGEALRHIGLSQRKVLSLYDLAAKPSHGSLPLDETDLTAQSDEENRGTADHGERDRRTNFRFLASAPIDSRRWHVRGHSVETELVALDVLHHEARLVVLIGKQ